MQSMLDETDPLTVYQVEWGGSSFLSVGCSGPVFSPPLWVPSGCWLCQHSFPGFERTIGHVPLMVTSGDWRPDFCAFAGVGSRIAPNTWPTTMIYTLGDSKKSPCLKEPWVKVVIL